MRIKLTDPQRDVGLVAARFLEEKVPLARLRELTDEADAGKSVLAIEESTWASCAALGWFALGIPASAGGVGCGPGEEVILFTELGRHLAPGPFVPTVMAGWVATAAGERGLAADFFEGRQRAGLEVGRFVQDGEPGGFVVSVNGTTLELCEIRSSVPVPSVVEPSLNVTVPVGVPTPGDVAVTVDVKVTGWPDTDGLTDDASAVVVASLLTTRLVAVDMLVTSFASPPH